MLFGNRTKASVDAEISFNFCDSMLIYCCAQSARQIAELAENVLSCNLLPQLCTSSLNCAFFCHVISLKPLVIDVRMIGELY